jgi:hypothetical protein
MHHLTDNGEKLEVAKKHFVMFVQFKESTLPARSSGNTRMVHQGNAAQRQTETGNQSNRIFGNMLAFIDRYQKELTESKAIAVMAIAFL